MTSVKLRERENKPIYVYLGKYIVVMVIEIKKAMSKAEIQRALDRIPNRKKLNAKQFLGTVKWPEDPVAYQKRLRDEW